MQKPLNEFTMGNLFSLDLSEYHEKMLTDGA